MSLRGLLEPDAVKAARPVLRGAERSDALGLPGGDALHGPLIDGHRTFLFCFIDDHSRLLAGYRWAAREDVLNASRALRAGIAAGGRPKAVYVDYADLLVKPTLVRKSFHRGMLAAFGSA